MGNRVLDTPYITMNIGVCTQRVHCVETLSIFSSKFIQQRGFENHQAKIHQDAIEILIQKA